MACLVGNQELLLMQMSKHAAFPVHEHALLFCIKAVMILLFTCCLRCGIAGDPEVDVGMMCIVIAFAD